MPRGGEGEQAQLVSLRDITDRKRAAERAHRLLLEQSAREEAERAGRRASFLAEAGARLDASLDPQMTLVTLAEQIVPRMGDWCVIDLTEADGVRRASAVHSDAAKQPLLDQLASRYAPAAGVDARQPAGRVLHTGTPELNRDIDEDRLRELAIDGEHFRVLSQLGIRSSVTVPLRIQREVRGAVTIVCADHNFDTSDVALAADVADRAGQALGNARLYEAAVAANKARSDFLAVMSHELRTPLNVILGYTQLLLGGITGDPDSVQTRHLHRINDSAQHLLRLIQKILAFASMEAARLEAHADVVRLQDVIDEIVTVAEPLARESGLEFHVAVADPDAALVTDAGKLRQITLDLLTNAIKFTEEGRVDLSAALRDGALYIEVRDSGVGIAPEHIGRIFEAFWQAESSLTRHRGGTGLGLTVSQRLASILGGDIRVDSEVGAGSTFTLRVPARAPTGSPG